MMRTVCLIFLALILLSSATQFLYYRSMVNLMNKDLTDTALAASDHNK